MNILLDLKSTAFDEAFRIERLCEALGFSIQHLQFGVRAVKNADVIIAHQILDHTRTLFVANTGLHNSCPDLVARALQTTESIIVSKHAYNLNLPVINSPFITEQLIKSIARLARMGPGTGDFANCRYLIVGERPGNKPSLGETDEAFFSIEGSSRWLSKQIDIVTTSREGFYWINAFNRAGDATDWSFLQSDTFLKLNPNPPEIFALGGVAFDVLTKAGITSHKLPHPQYWKRFKSKFEYPLVTLLKEMHK